MDKAIKDIPTNCRAAFVRLLTDMLKADRVIDYDEIMLFEELFGAEADSQLFVDAQRISFAEAIRTLKTNANLPQHKNFMRQLHRMALSDGFTAPQEALLYVATKFCFCLVDTPKTEITYEAISLPLEDVFVGKRYVIYVEDIYNETLNDQIKRNYKLIVNLLSSIGFQFVYIPEFSKLYSCELEWDKRRDAGVGLARPRTGLERFRLFTKFFFPAIPPNRVKTAFNAIRNLTTVSFVNGYFKDRMGYAESLHVTRPGLMMMLGRSEVLDLTSSGRRLPLVSYANFLKIKFPAPTGKGMPPNLVVDTINLLVNEYNACVSYKHTHTFNPNLDKLVFSGFFRMVFNIVAVAHEPAGRRIEILTASQMAPAAQKKILKIIINDRKLNLIPSTIAIFVFILLMSVLGDRRGLINGTDRGDYDEDILLLYQSLSRQLLGKASKAKLKHKVLQSRVGEINKAANDIGIKNLVVTNDGYWRVADIVAELVFINGVPLEPNSCWPFK